MSLDADKGRSSPRSSVWILILSDGKGPRSSKLFARRPSPCVSPVIFRKGRLVSKISLHICEFETQKLRFTSAPSRPATSRKAAPHLCHEQRMRMSTSNKWRRIVGSSRRHTRPRPLGVCLATVRASFEPAHLDDGAMVRRDCGGEVRAAGWRARVRPPRARRRRE